MNYIESIDEYTKKLSVMYVEDDPDTSRQIIRFLSYRFGSVFSAATGVAGLEVFRAHCPHIVITDILIPEMDGLTMVEEIRKIDPSVSIIVMTAFEDSGYLLRSIDIGVDRYVIKPVDFDRLAQALLFCVQRRYADKALQTSEKVYRNLFNDHAAVQLIIDSDTGDIAAANNAATEFYGFDSERPLQMKIQDINVLPPDVILKDMKNARTARKAHFEFRHRLADGSIRDIEAFTSSISFGDKVYLHSIIHDISERKRSQEALNHVLAQLEDRVKERTFELMKANEQLVAEMAERQLAVVALEQSRQRLKAIFDAISDPLILVDRQMVIRMANAAAKRYFQANSSEDIVDMTCWKKMITICESSCDNCAIPFRIFEGTEYSFVRKGCINSERIESVTVFPIQAENIQNLGAVIRITDITEARMMEESLQRTQKLASIGVLSSGIAHEINNPNNFIMFNIPVLRRYLDVMLPITREYTAKHPDIGEDRFFGMSFKEFENNIVELANSIENGSQRIKNIVAGLKDFSSIGDRGGAVWGYPQEAIQQALRIAGVQLKNRVQQIDVTLPETRSRVYFESGGLEQVIVNILINATQAMNKKNSWIRLSAGVEGEEKNFFVIEIADNGCGMDDRSIQRIFDPFYTTKDTGQGTGLGLYVCHNLIEKMGGRIDVVSRLGEGSIFRIVLLCE